MLVRGYAYLALCKNAVHVLFLPSFFSPQVCLGRQKVQARSAVPFAVKLLPGF